MALFGLSHSVISNAKQDPGTAGQRARYIMRDTASAELCGDLPQHVGLDRSSVAHWLETEAIYNERVNGRVCEQFILTLPRELQRAGDPDLPAMRALVEDFARTIGEGKIPWVGSIHALANDRSQPHAHILVRNRAMDGSGRGRNVISWFNKMGSVERHRETWAGCVNRALARQGFADRSVDHRSNTRRGLAPTRRAHLPVAEYKRRQRDKNIAAYQREKFF